MNLPIPQIRPHRRRKHPHLLNAPPQRPRKQRKRHALCAPVEVLAHPLAQLLEALVLGPRVDGPFYRNHNDVDEPRGVHHVGHFGDGVEREASFVRALLHVLVPLVEVVFGRERVVVASEYEVDVVHFEPAVRVEVFVTLGDEAGPVFVGADHHLRVDVVELAREGPFLFEVVDFEGQVWGNAGDGQLELGGGRGPVCYLCGCTGARSTPRTSVSGCSSAGVIRSCIHWR